MHLKDHSRKIVWAFVAFLAMGGLIGCGPQSEEQRIDTELKRLGEARVKVYPFAGRVTIDGQPPKAAKARERTILMLNDLSKLDVPPNKRQFVVCGPQGEFAFSAYGAGDGIPPGKYVVTIGQYFYSKKNGYTSPDLLKNLYNDPEKNAKNPEFVIDHKDPGKSDYVFNLEIAGKEAATPGPKAITEIPD